ncbi:MAG: hypothetical protein ACL93V_09615 [Candidatus Electrothrix sp. YB6]
MSKKFIKLFVGDYNNMSLLGSIQSLILITCMLLFVTAAPVRADTAPSPRIPKENSSVVDDCDIRWLEGQDSGELRRFDSELRLALTARDVTQVALLTRFPLRVSGPGRGAITILDPEALQDRFSEIFPRYIRTAVLNTKHISCSAQGVMYGMRGDLWVKPEVVDDHLSYYISTVNLQTDKQQAKHNDERLIDFVCRTPKYRIVVDTDNTDSSCSYRYRVWNVPKALSFPPDLTINANCDAMEFQGTWPCVHRIWTFRNGTATYSISEPGCTGDGVPEETTGFLSVEINEEEKLSMYCR